MQVTVSCSNDAVFAPLITELLSLQENGIIVHVQNEEKTVYFQLASLLGDNLGMNSILGFSESFSSNSCCRFCKIEKKKI